VLHGWTAIRDVLIEEALKICDETLKRMPEAPGIYANRGMIYLAIYEYDRAIADARRAVELAPEVGPGHHIYARALVAKGRFDEAYREAMTAIRLQPNVFPNYLLSLGIVCLLRNQNADAVLALRKYSELAPHLTHGVAMLAAALSANGQQDEAANIAAALMKIDPNLTIDDVLRPYPMQDLVHGDKLAGYLIAAGFSN